MDGYGLLNIRDDERKPSVMNVNDWGGKDVIDRDGSKIGKVEDVYLDKDTNVPEWLRVRTGLFGTRDTFVPVTEAQPTEDGIRVPFEKAVVKDAPNIDDASELSQEEEAILARYYGLEYSQSRSSTGLPESSGREHAVGTSGRGRDDAMTRSEEELRVGKARRPSELVRLKKHIVTEQKQMTVPVQREEVRVEREPITEANRAQAMSGPDIKEDEHAVTLNEEQVKVEKETVPKERVRLDKDVSTRNEQVDEEVRKEKIDVEREDRRGQR
jgi:uncharacterized protein (TIGR02271 family)